MVICAFSPLLGFGSELSRQLGNESWFLLLVTESLSTMCFEAET